MVERDVAIAKIGLVDRAIGRIRHVRARSDLEQIDSDELVVLNVQRAAQAAIDLAAHVLSSEGWRLPDSLGENFTILAEHGVIPDDLAASLRRMTGFRNVAVHTYEAIDPEIVEEIVTRHLDDLVKLSQCVIEKFGLDRNDERVREQQP